MNGVQTYHLLCIDCGTAIVADTIAKKERIPVHQTCPVCGEKRGDTWRPVEGTPEALEWLVNDYETVDVELNERNYYTVCEDGGPDE